MAPRAPIIAGQTVILVRVQDTVDAALKTIQGKLKRFASSLSSISFDLFRGGLIGTLPLGFILNDFRKFQDEILFLQTKLKGASLNIPFVEVEKTIRQLGRSTSFTAQEVAEAATSLAQAGFSAKRLTESLEPVLDLARGGRIDLTSAAAALANTMTVFNIEGSKANEVASQFIVAARSGTLNVLDLKESLKEVVGTLRTLNIDLPTSLALITQLARSSLKGTKAGTSLNTALLNLASKQDVLKETLGVDINDAQGNLRSYIDILEEIDTRLDNLGASQRLAVVQRLFNIRGGRAVTALQDIKNIRRLAAEIANAGDEAREAAKKMDSEFGGAIRFAVSAVQDLSLELGKIISGPLTQLLRIVPPIANALQVIFAANPNLILGIAAIPPALLAIGSAGLVASFVLARLASLLGGLRAAFNYVATAVIYFAKFVLTKTLLSVLILIGLQLDVVHELLADFNKLIRNIVSNIAAIGKEIQPAIRLIQAAAKQISEGNSAFGLGLIEKSLVAISDIIRIRLTVAWAHFYNSIRPALDFLNKAFEGTLTLLSAIGHTLTRIFSGTIITGVGKDAVKGVIKELLNPEYIKFFLESLGSAIILGVEGIASGLEYLWKSINLILASITESIISFLDQMSLVFTTIGRSFGLHAVDITTIQDAIGNIQGDLAQFAVARRGQDTDIFTQFNKDLDTILGVFIKNLNAIFSQTLKPQDTKGPLGKLDSIATNLSSLFKLNAAADFKNPFQNAGAFLSNLPQAIRDGVSKLALPGSGSSSTLNPFAGFQNIGNKLKEQFLEGTVDVSNADRKELARKLRLSASRSRIEANHLEEGFLATLPRLTDGPRDTQYRKETETRISSLRRKAKEEDEQAKLVLTAFKTKPKQQQQASNIRNIIASTVGSIQETRLNKLRKKDNPQEQTNDLLKTISGQLGGTSDPFLKQLVDKQGGVAFQ